MTMIWLLMPPPPKSPSGNPPPSSNLPPPSHPPPRTPLPPPGSPPQSDAAKRGENSQESLDQHMLMVVETVSTSSQLEMTKDGGG